MRVEEERRGERREEEHGQTCLTLGEGYLKRKKKHRCGAWLRHKEEDLSLDLQHISRSQCGAFL